MQISIVATPQRLSVDEQEEEERGGRVIEECRRLLKKVKGNFFFLKL